MYVGSEAMIGREAAASGGAHSSSGFERFFRANYATVARIAGGVLGDSHSAQDVAQEVFIAAQRRFPEPDGSSHATAWVRVAAVHLALNASRSRRRRDRRQLRSGFVAGGAHPVGPEELVIEQATRDEVRAALARLPLRSSTVLLLRHSGLSYAEVAEAMGVPVGHVGTILRRAEAALRKEIERAAHS
jgi:RNA polymerase sigma-70 factor (ECF subfamily)